MHIALPRLFAGGALVGCPRLGRTDGERDGLGRVVGYDAGRDRPRGASLISHVEPLYTECLGTTMLIGRLCE